MVGENDPVTPIPPRLRPLLDAASPVQQLAGRLVAGGHRCYLVGGSVRDALLDVPQEGIDVDVATDARPDAVERIVRGWADHVWLQGQRFGTVGCEKDAIRIEITTFRAEVYRPESRKPEVAFADDIETDLSRRDFTINAMALRLPDPELVDPFDGAADLAAKRLRTPLEPELWFLCRTGLSDEFMPELNAMKLEQDPIHQHKDVLAHTIAVVRKTRAELRVRLAALLHDIGKPKTLSVGPGGVSFHHHEVVGARMAEERLRALRFPSEVVENVARLVYLHLRVHTYSMGWTDKAVRRYVRDAGPLLEPLNHLVRQDCTTRNKVKARALNRRIDELEERVAQLRAQEEIDRIRPPLDGRQVMAFLGLEPGPIVGDALDYLLELRLDEGPIDEDEAYERLTAWARERGIEPAG